VITRILRASILGLVVALLLGGCSSGSDENGNGAPFEVPGSPVRTTSVDLPKSYLFQPAVIEVAAGTTVRWTNHDEFTHSVELLDGSDVNKNLPPGDTATITFSKPGTIYYQCSYHPQTMHGKVIVTSA
jgi:plastocyanin